MTSLELEYRAATAVGVNFPKRLIELVVMPYETETMVMHRGRQVREIVSRGAFDGISADQRRINVNRNHDRNDVIGKAIRFHPSRTEGLVAELQITRASGGDDVLTQADEGLLDASAGFGVMDGGEEWPERGLRRLTKLWLDHVAMTPDPAYPTANVLAVRDTPGDESVLVVATPNLDVLRGWRLADRYAKLG